LTDRARPVLDEDNPEAEWQVPTDTTMTALLAA